MATLWTSLRGRTGLAWIFDNPLLVREMRRRMRGRSFSWSLIAYLAALGLVSCFLMYSNYPHLGTQLSTREMIQRVGTIGSRLFTGMCFVEAVIALIVTPMITAGLATAEKEKDTFEFLQVTTLSPGTFVIGCLLTTGLFLIMVFACTLPILGLTFIFGGVSLGDILIFNGVLFLLSLTISAWGIFNSTSYKRSRTVLGAIALVLVLLMVLGVALIGAFFGRYLGFSSMTTGTGAFYGYSSLALVTLMGAFSVAAARRLYEPNNRLFSYKQFIAFFIVSLSMVTGLVYWHAHPGAASSTFSENDRRGVLLLFYGFGWFLVNTAILIFSAGRMERGDELWRLRLERPAFRQGLDAGLVYVLLGTLWLVTSFALARSFENPMNVIDSLFLALAPFLSATFLFYAVCRMMSVATQTRNRAAVGALGVMAVFWILIPLLGVFVGEVSSAGGLQPSWIVETVSETLADLSPPVMLSRITNDPSTGGILRASGLTLGLGLLFYLPTLAESLRRRLVVSYDYQVRRDLAGTAPTDGLPSESA
jgi:hypothetical protein